MQVNAIPQIVYDLSCNFGEDIVASNHALLFVSGEDRSKQRVLRRLLTALNSYVWHADYGAGLPGFIGQPLSPDNYTQITSLINSNMLLEDSVSQNPPPQIMIQSIGNGVSIQINYTINPTQNPVVLSFDLGTT